MTVIQRVKKMTMGQFAGRQLFNEIDRMMSGIEAFHRKNIFLDKTTREVITKIHEDYDDDETKMIQGKDEAILKMHEKIEKEFEQRLLQRKLRALREEHAILTKHELWGK